MQPALADQTVTEQTAHYGGDAFFHQRFPGGGTK